MREARGFRDVRWRPGVDPVDMAAAGNKAWILFISQDLVMAHNLHCEVMMVRRRKRINYLLLGGVSTSRLLPYL